MDFDAYDYLEKTVENPEPGKEKEGAVNGGGEIEKSGNKERSRSSKHKSDERDDDVERRSKRSRSEDESRDRDRDRQRERGSSRHRSRSRDGERDRHRSGREQRDKERDRDREERNGNVKERDRDREKERGRDRDRERDRRERDRENEKEKEREKERSRRSRSESERQRGERDEREKSRDKELKERERERESRERDRESRRYKEKKEEVAEPEADPERDQRTVFAYQICLKANERDVYEFFSKAGKVRDVRLIMDRNSRRSKGVGYVFEAFGQVELVQLPVDETGRCKGYGFVQFACLEDARNALSLNQQLEIACQLIKVSALTDQAGMQDVGANSGDFDNDEGGGLKLDRSGSGSSVAGSAGTPVVNSTGLTLPTVPILGAAPAVSPITPLVPALAGLGGSGLQVPIATLPTVDTIGVPVNDMFDPNDEVPQAYEAKFPDSRQDLWMCSEKMAFACL
ncbi:putative rna-binding protein 23 [Quercus suber]|uniref:Rna-binding protein 23 n=1 Tax=Quercus suber TaxID=58331 RepID=A0AAW0M0K5_QUESU